MVENTEFRVKVAQKGETIKEEGLIEFPADNDSKIYIHKSCILAILPDRRDHDQGPVVRSQIFWLTGPPQLQQITQNTLAHTQVLVSSVPIPPEEARRLLD